MENVFNSELKESVYFNNLELVLKQNQLLEIMPKYESSVHSCLESDSGGVKKN